jgi:hypothetical protein
MMPTGSIKVSGLPSVGEYQQQDHWAVIAVELMPAQLHPARSLFASDRHEPASEMMGNDTRLNLMFTGVHQACTPL